MPWLLRLLAMKYGPRIAKKIYNRIQARRGVGPAPGTGQTRRGRR